MTIYLIYSNVGCETGRRLGEELDVEYGQNPEIRYDYILRWGSSERIRYRPSIDVINKRTAVANNVNKYNSLKVMDTNGINTPKFSRNYRDLQLPMLARSSNHSMGRGLGLILQEQDLNFTDYDYFLEYIPKKAEFRLHIIDGEIVKISQKVYRPSEREEEIEYNPICWNYENGFKFINPRIDLSDMDKRMSINAVDSLDLDFGAVDGILSENNIFYILEINTCPSLDDNSFELYVDRFKEMLNLEV